MQRLLRNQQKNEEKTKVVGYREVILHGIYFGNTFLQGSVEVVRVFQSIYYCRYSKRYLKI